ncbi:MAG: alpha-N-arabinofuranosidase [Lachnospiraceae bacterium]|nr:alpha-N-arabinofuranosidase [Lachnospiraceae bacterium]
MEQIRIVLDKDYILGDVDRRLFGSFVEHMGRVVYTGIYEKDHPTADENGFRRDVAKRVKDMGVTCIRYPGGNFVSNYHWMDGIGPAEKRPKKRDLAWKSIETNEVGIDEFMKWANTYDLEPIMAVNLGTGTLQEAVNLVEYCNSTVGSYYSDLRAENGHKDPYGIKTWCLGNEMDGEWQIGHKTAAEYGRIAHEMGKAMKLMDPSIQLVVCGSSMSRNATFGTWEREVLSQTYEEADYISLHQYYGGQEKGTAGFLAQSLDMERYIDLVCGIADLEKTKRKSKKTLEISFDEWGVWSTSDTEVQKWVEEHPWQSAPPLGEQIYSMEDALLFASMMMVLLRKCSRVKIGCQSLLTNISSCIMTEKGGGTWVQPIYHVFRMIACYGAGQVLDARYKGPHYDTSDFTEVPVVDSLCVYREEEQMLTCYFVNRTGIRQQVELETHGLLAQEVAETAVLTAKDIKQTNYEDHEAVKPYPADFVRLQQGKAVVTLEPYAFQMVRITLK